MLTEFFNTAALNLRPQEQREVGQLALRSTGFISDLSGSIRNKFSLFNRLEGKENPIALAAIGVTTCFNAISGYFAFREGNEEAKQSIRVGDLWGRVQAEIKTVRGLIQGFGGIFYIPIRGLTIASHFNNSSQSLSRVTFILNEIGSSIFSLVNTLVGIPAAMALHRSRVFRDTVKSDLQERTEASFQRCLEHLQESLSVSEEEYRHIEESGVANVQNAAACLLLKKERIMAASSSPECVNLIKRARFSDARAVVEEVLAENQKRMIISSAVIAVCIIGFIPTMLSLLVAGEAIALAAGVLSVIGSVGWILIDGYELYLAFKRNEAGRYDQLWILISSLICLGMSAIVFKIALDPAVLLITGVFAVTWLLFNLFCAYRLGHLQV